MESLPSTFLIALLAPLSKVLAVESPSILAAEGEYSLVWVDAGVRARSEVDNTLFLNTFNILMVKRREVGIICSEVGVGCDGDDVILSPGRASHRWHTSLP